MTREDPAAFAPPPAFGPFRVLHQIGVGALGPVFRTYEPTRDRLIAIKAFRLDITPEQAQVLADELSRAADAGLFHPSIVEPVAAGLEGSLAYRAEEYVAAETLDVAIRHYAPAPLDRVLTFVTPLAGAIDFARAAGIGHGALHLRDVFVTPDEVRIGGFGVVEAVERAGLRAPVRRPYSAPERVAGGPWRTPADVFSLAVIVYELLTGRRPAGTGGGIGDLEMAGPDAAHARLVQEVLERAMDDDPAARFQSALGFVSALEAAGRGEPVSGTVGQAGAIAAAAVASPGRPAPPDAVEDAAPEDDADVDDTGADDAGVDDADVDDADVDDADVDDITVERDEDAAYYEFAEEEESFSDRGDAGETARFDDVEIEAETDLALTPPVVPLEDDGPAGDEEILLASAAASVPGAAGFRDERDAYEGPGRGDLFNREHSQPTMPYGEPEPVYGARVRDSQDPADAEPAYLPRVEPSRSDLVPRAILLFLGLLIGFAAGYAARGGAATADPGQTAAIVDEPRAEQPPSAVAGADTDQPVLPPAPPPDLPDEVPAAATGRLVVNSTPAKAAVTINGEWRGRTPLTLDEQPFGTYDVRVVQEGYAVATQQVELSASNPSRTLAMRLERAAPARPAPTPPRAKPAPARTAPPATQKPVAYTGSMYVDSRPRGARVVLNGKVVGTTPLRLPDVAIGSHVVRLELEDHRIWSTSARVQAGQEARVTGSLDPIR
jgi:hypothetical protein